MSRVSLVLTCFVVTVSVYCTLYFLFTSIFCSSQSLFFVARILVLLKARQKGTFGLAYFLAFGTETANQMSRILLQFLSWISMLLLCPSILTDIKCKVMCWSFCKYVETWKYKLPRKKMYIELTREKSITARGQNDSVFININIYWVWQPSDCYMHFLGKLEDLYGSSFSTL